MINHTAIGVMTNLAIPFAWGPLHQLRFLAPAKSAMSHQNTLNHTIWGIPVMFVGF